MKKINHWINGKNVAGNDYFQTTNPATGEVLADVASGGEAEINQAVAAAKEAFPKWANLPMKERARLMRRLGDLIDQNVPEIAAMETADTGLPIHQTKNVLIPRASHNFEFFAEVCQQMNGKTYPVHIRCIKLYNFICRFLNKPNIVLIINYYIYIFDIYSFFILNNCICPIFNICTFI